MIMKNKKGFSLIEVMVVLTIISMTICMSLPIFIANNPNKTLVKKAFFILREGTNELTLNDTDLTATYCNDFFAKVNTIPHNFFGSVYEANNCDDTAAGNMNFVTTNGMYFKGMGQNPSSGDIDVTVDVNGSSGQNEENIDVFKFTVYSNGRVVPKSTKAKEYIFCQLKIWGNIVNENNTINAMMTVAGLTTAEANNIIDDQVNGLPFTLASSISYTNAYNNVISPLKLFTSSPEAGVNIVYYD